jgi:O-methyltransferase involved in polyketide biosynthesis
MQGLLQGHTIPSPTPCSIDKTQFPLRCGSWAAVPCDLSDASWVDALKEAGWDPAKPTVWVAEGLLMYLEEERVRSLLRTMADSSAEGSAFIGLSVTSAVIDRIRARGPSKGAASLMDTWVFGCPPNPTEFLAECGWQLRLANDRSQQAAALGLDPQLCAFLPATNGSGQDGVRDAKEAASLFMTATPLAAAAQ